MPTADDESQDGPYRSHDAGVADASGGGDASPTTSDDAAVDMLPVGGTGLVQTTLSPSTEDFLNPERGFFVTPNDGEMVQSTLTGFVGSWHTRLFLYIVELNSYTNTTTLPTTLINTLNTRFAEGRKAGVKFIVLVNYSQSGGGADAPIAIVQAHASQLKSVFTTNADVIPYVKAGFIGPWGEWHDSTNSLDTKNNKKLVKDAVLTMAAPTTQVQFTNVFTMQEDWFPTVLGATDAFNGSDKARSGMHSDCFMTGNGDSYRYTGPSTVVDFTIAKSRLEQRQYAQSMTEYVPFGGETCDDSQGARQQKRTACSGDTDEVGQSGGILNEGPRYHLAWLNAGYSPEFIDRWKNDGCFDQVSRSIGYRFQLDAVDHPQSAMRGTSINVNVDLRNVGWSRIFSARPLVVTLKHKTTGALITASAGDARQLPSQATSSTKVIVNVGIDSAAAVGDYDVYLSMPDIWPNTKDRSEYAVRFANSENAGKGQAWDATAARFKIGTTLSVQ